MSEHASDNVKNGNQSNGSGVLGALSDLAIVVFVLVAIKQSVLPYSIVFAGPVSTVSAMMVASLLLHRRNSSWGDLGLRWPQSWLRTFLLSVAIFVIFLPTAGLSSELADFWFEDVGASGRFDFVEGNLLAYLMMLGVVWTHGSFFEELLFRAFIISKLIAGMGDRRWARIAAVVVAAIFFGYRHYYYQGLHGALVTGCIGFVFGLIYLKLRTSTILPLIIVHGAVNTIAQTDRFLG